MSIKGGGHFTNDKKSVMCSYSTEAYRCNAQIRSNESERHPLEDIWRGLQQVAVALLSTVKLQAFNAINGVNIPCFKDFSEQSLNVRERIIKLE